MEVWLCSLIAAMSLPRFGLSTVFIVAVVSATLLPMGSEPAVFGLIKLQPELFWQTILIATLGNAIGGGINWWLGYGVKRAYETYKHSKVQATALAWLQQLGPKACVFAFLPIVGDPLATVAGWLKLPFWPCFLWGAAGKFCRYVVMTVVLLWFFPGQFESGMFCATP
jgi:membrane protein YqaA with SNARE-associated domain